MSLTSMLKGNTKECIELQSIIKSINIDENKIIETNLENKIVVPYRLSNYKKAGLVGTAFDYVARFILKKYQYSINGIITNEKTYVAKKGLDILICKDDSKAEKAEQCYEKALDLIDEYIKTSNVDIVQIINVAIFLAKLEYVYRSGYIQNAEIIRILFTKESQNVIDEIYNLQDSFEKNFINNHFKMKENPYTVFYNPTFGMCSAVVGGADADIIMDNTIIDFKTTKNLNSIKKDFEQILGYYLFSKNLNMESVDSISLYLVRYNKFVSYKFDGSEFDSAADIKFRKFMAKVIKANPMLKFLEEQEKRKNSFI